MILILAAVATALVLGLNLGLLLAGGGGGIVEAGLSLALLGELAALWMRHERRGTVSTGSRESLQQMVDGLGRFAQLKKLAQSDLDSERLTPQRRARLRAVRSAYEPPRGDAA